MALQLSRCSRTCRASTAPYVFPGTVPGRPLREFKRVWYAIRNAAGLEDVRLHDLMRHSLASVSAAHGHSLFVTGALLGHTNPATTAKYAHLHDDIRHAAADTVARAIVEAMNAGATINGRSSGDGSGRAASHDRARPRG